MLLGGDEFGRTQNGNNNAYCHDDALGWIDWTATHDKDHALAAGFVHTLLEFRAKHSVLRRPRFLHGNETSPNGVKDIVWYCPQGTEQSLEQWQDGNARCIGLLLNGAAGHYMDAYGQTETDDVLLILLNAHHAPVPFTLPDIGGTGWQALLDTTKPDGIAEPVEHACGTCVSLNGRMLLVLCLKS